MSSSPAVVDAEDILKLFSLYLSEHGEKLLIRAHQFTNVTHLYSPLSHSVHSNSNFQPNSKETLRITHDFLKVCAIDPCLINDYEVPTSSSNSLDSSKVSSKDSSEVEKSVVERWWERRKKIHSEWMEKLSSNRTLLEDSMYYCNLL